MILPDEIVKLINDYLRPLPTLKTINNWRKGSKRFDINELKSAYIIYNNNCIKKSYICDLYKYNIYKENPRLACNCDDYHRIRLNFTWNTNYLALWKKLNKGYKLIWQYVYVFQCDSCGDFHLQHHLILDDNSNFKCISCNKYGL